MSPQRCLPGEASERRRHFLIKLYTSHEHHGELLSRSQWGGSNPTVHNHIFTGRTGKQFGDRGPGAEQTDEDCDERVFVEPLHQRLTPGCVLYALHTYTGFVEKLHLWRHNVRSDSILTR